MSQPRVGVGYDSHRFASDAAGPGGTPLILGGIEIPGGRGLEGHSDADVAAHALSDALLGAAGLGDIGAHFPPDDERWRDADSIELLRSVVEAISGRVLNADLTLIAEQPRLAPHRAAMEQSLSAAAGAPVSVKATSNEAMGWIGRGEGIACLAVALVELRA